MYKVKFTKIKFFLLGLFILGIINIPNISFADTQIQVQEGDINVETVPNNPQPYDDVTINISSYATDLNSAIITWQGNGSTLLSGIGKTSYSFKAGGPNTTQTININITPAGSLSSITKSVTIAPSEIDLLWQSLDGYTPPFYKGKDLPSKGSTIRVVAIPNTDTIKSGNGSLTYTWQNGGNAVTDASGYNKNSYDFKNSLFDDINEITVIASSVSGDYTAENTAEIPVYDPQIIFYKRSPTEGVLYNNALGPETTMTEDEMTVVAEPYFLALKGNEDNFTYNWQINGNDIETPSKKSELTVRPTSHGGYATIDIMIENANALFQKVSNELKLNL
jgi:hypothetical protein